MLAVTAGAADLARAEFPWPKPPPGAEGDYAALRAGPGQTPNDLGGDNVWKFAATPGGAPGEQLDARWVAGGARGAHVVDASREAQTAWRTTTGRPDVTIAVLDSGIRWDSAGAMEDLRRKTRLSRGELPSPEADRATGLEGADCTAFTAGRDDANGDGVFNVLDFLCDSRVSADPPRGVGPPDVLDPQDVLIAFSDGDDADRNGFVDDVVGWDFLDDDNDPFDDVRYGHGTGEAEGSAAEVHNGQGDEGACPNCMVIHMRVGDSFIADANDFAQATIYAVDNDALVVQEALGTLNNTSLARDAIEYAYDHGVAVIASAADEAAQHHNMVSSLPHTIVVNSIRRYQDATTPFPRSYLQFNGCTNFSSKITISIPSTSCSSDATGVASGLAGLVYSAALNARDAGELPPHPRCRRPDGSRCALTANEVRQVLASGEVGGTQQSDDVSFTEGPEPGCSPAPAPGCTDPNGALQAQVSASRPVVSPVATTRSYPARDGHDQFYGWGRVNTNRAVKATAAAHVPPEVEITGPEWFSQVDPERPAVAIEGHVHARGERYTCRVLVAPGSYPNNATDFEEVPSGVCDGETRHTRRLDGTLGVIAISQLRSRFPADAGDFRGRETGHGAGQTANGRPNAEPYGFVVRVEASTAGPPAMSGHDRRNLYLHRDRDMLAGFPKELPSDGESSPLFVDLDGDNRNELVFATADGTVHAQRRDGSEPRGWPNTGDPLPLHADARAFRTREVAPKAGAFLASPAAGDLDHDGAPEVVAADFEGKVYAWSATGERLWTRQTNVAFSGKPLEPFVNVRRGKRHRTQRGFIGSPVLADLDRDDGGRLEVIAAAMDRHVYAWNHDGTEVPGFPVLVVDRRKISAIDPVTHVPTFDEDAGDELNQGAIVHTPAVWDVAGDRRPEIVVGTNEEYRVHTGDEGPFNAGNFALGALAPLFREADVDLADSNGRVYALHPDGDPGAPALDNAEIFADGWPVKIARLMSELLPVVGEGITGSPVVGPDSMRCAGGGEGPKVGVMPDAGPAYVLNGDGSSCQGSSPDGRHNALQTEPAASPTEDRPVIPAVGHPAFGSFASAPGQVSFLAPATGLLRALDVAMSEYQFGGQDYLAAWDPVSGQQRPGFPARVNDLQFLTGPSIADVDGRLPAREEMVGGTAHLDLAAFDETGQPAGARWPKLTSDWVVANPLIGSWGTRDTDPQARKVVVASTRSGFFFAYATGAPACSPGSWPRFHHDNANSGAYDRDAVAPGRPDGVSATPAGVAFRAPGDDLLCGRVAGYEVVTSAEPVDAASFAAAQRVEPAAPVAPAEPGADQAIALPADLERYVAVRARDEQGNVGRPALVDTRSG